MTSQNSQSPRSTRNERRGSLSSFESLLRLDDTKGAGDARQAGTGSAVLYLRVSTQRQMLTAIDLDPDGNSIATQREATVKRAKRLKAPIIREFVEPGHSAQSISKRPVFRELLQFVEDNPEVDYVIIYMRSRVFRNQTDAAITKRILDSMGVRLISAKEEFGEGYMADAMEAITDIMNEVQVRQSGEDISNKMYHKAKNGGTVGRARLGYLNVRKDVDGHLVNSIDLDPKRAPLITWAFEQYATGEYTLMRLRQELEDQGLTTRRTAKWEEKGLSRSQLAVILRDPYYLGMLPYRGEVFAGKHAALVTPEVFERVQLVLNDRQRRTQRDRLHSHVFRGMLLCGRCHAAGRRFQMVYTKVEGRNGVLNEYYHCIGRQQGKCDLPYLPVSLVEAAVLREVKSIRVTETEAADLQEQVEAQLEIRLRSEREARARIKKEMDSLDVKEERLLDLASDGALTTESVKQRLAKLQVQRHSLLKRLQMTEDMIRQEGYVVSQYLELLEKPGEFYAASNDMVKRKLLNAFFTHIWIDDDQHRVNPTTQPQPIVTHIHQQARQKQAENKGTESLLSAFETSYSLGIYSNMTNLVGVTGLEPVTSRM